MLTELCAEVRNYFIVHREKDIHVGEYVIADGSVSVDFLRMGQYYRIVGSALNDGVHRYGEGTLADETFDGSIWAMSVPQSFIVLANEIEDWCSAHSAELSSPYTSESFAGYSYSKNTGRSGGGYSWQDQFATRLNAYRRLSVL